MSERVEERIEGDGGGVEVKSEGGQETALVAGTEEMENKVRI